MEGRQGKDKGLGEKGLENFEKPFNAELPSLGVLLGHALGLTSPSSVFSSAKRELRGMLGLLPIGFEVR